MATKFVEDEAAGLELGTVVYITKPFHPAVIKARIGTHMTLKEAQKDIEQQSEYLEAEVLRRTGQVTQAYEDQRKQEKRFHSLVSNIPRVVYRYALDEHRTMEFIGDGIKAISGYPAEKFINNRARSFASIIHQDDVDRVDQVVREAIACHHP
ncbi:MAG: hypothetical protein ABW153_11335 [Sedimenticola sp.]